MSKEQTALERIKDEVAKEAYCLDWNHLVHKYPSSKDTKYWPIVIERYTRECCQATLEKAAGNAKTKKYGNSGSWFDASVDKSSITNKDNIVIL